MNRFWGRTDNSSTVKFSRDDEQILALNYENLCDGDYLQRLFVTDAMATSDDDIQNSESISEHSLYSCDISEDLMIFGNNVELSRDFFQRRLMRELTSKNSDLVTNIVNRQVVVFEHIGKLMMERCSAPLLNSTQSKPGVTAQGASTSNRSQLLSRMAENALVSGLKTMKKQSLHQLKRTSVESVISVMFQVFSNKSNAARNDQLAGPAVAFPRASCSTELAENLRFIFQKGIARLLSTPVVGGSTDNTADMENEIRANSKMLDALRLALTCFYGLLGLGLHSRDQADILLAASHLTAILAYAEDWQDSYSRKVKGRIAALMASMEPPPVATPTSAAPVMAPSAAVMPGPLPLQQKTASAGKLTMPVKPKQQQNASDSNGKVANTESKAARRPNRDGDAKEAAAGVGGVPVPGIKGVREEGALGLGLDDSRHEKETTVVGPGARRSSDINQILLIPPGNTESKPSTAAGGSGKTIPTADGAPNTKQPVVVVATKPSASEKEQMSRSKMQAVKNGTGKTASSSAASESGRLLSATEVEIVAGLMAASNMNDPALTVNHVSVNYEHAGMCTPPVHMQKNSNYNKNNNNNTLSPTSYPETSLSNTPIRPVVNHSQTECEMLRRDLRDFRETLSRVLRVPKPILVLLYDACHDISSVSGSPSASPKSSGNDQTKGASATAASTAASRTGASREASSSRNSSSYVWASGQNSYGELGVGDILMRKTFAKVSSLDQKGIVSIGAGNEHSLFVGRGGKLYTAGYNDNGQCGTGNMQQVRQPTLVHALEGEDVAQVHVYNGCEHTLAVTKDGKLFAFGYNYRGQLGLGTTSSESTPRPVRTLLTRKVVLAACSYHHSVMLCSDGGVYSCGRNDSGQLGHGDTADKKTPHPVVNTPRGVTSISCGQFHTIASTTAGVAYACGKNDYGQLGIESTSNVKILTKISSIPSEVDGIVQVCCGYYHTLLLSSAGIVAGFGRNDYGQLGLSHATPKVYQCAVIGSLRDKGVTMVSAGCYHSVVVTTNGMLYVFGRNNHGQLATGDVEERHTPHPVDDFVGQHILSVAAGFYHTLVLVSDSAGLPGAEDGALSPRAAVRGKLVANTVAMASDGTLQPSAMNVSGAHSADTAALVRDAMHLTGLGAPSPPHKRVYEFSLDARSSRVSSRELLHFLMAHAEGLISTQPPLPLLTLPAKSSSDAPSVSAGSLSQPVTPTDESIHSVLSSAIALLNVYKRIAQDGEGGRVRLGVSADTALAFLHQLVRVVSSYLKAHKAAIRASLERTAVSLDGASSSDLIADLFAQRCSSGESGDSIDLCAVVKSAAAATPFTAESGLQGTVGALLRTLLSLHLIPPRREEDRRTRLHSLISDVALCVTKSHEVFLSTAQLSADFFCAMADHVLSGTTVVPAAAVSVAVPSTAVPGTATVSNNNSNNSNNSSSNKLTRRGSKTNNTTEVPVSKASSQQASPSPFLKLFSMFCSIYRNCDEVVKLFQRSKLCGMTVFRRALGLHHHFAKLSLEKRTASSSTGAQSADVRRIVSALEGSIPNFVKCAVPMIFTAPLNNNGDDNGDDDDEGTAVGKVGLDVLQEVFADAESVIDHLLVQAPMPDEVMRLGTMMVSILPSILIHGIAFTKHRGDMRAIVPNLSALLRKLQLVGRAEFAHATTAAANTKATTTGTTVEARKGVNSNTSSTTNVEMHHSSTVALLKSDNSSSSNGGNSASALGGSESTIDEAYLGRRECTSSWWHRLLKLCITLSAKMSVDQIAQHSHTVHGKENSDTSAKDSNNSSSALNTSTVVHHNVWKYVSLAAEDSKQPTVAASADEIVTVLQTDVDDNHTAAEVLELCQSFRVKEKSTDLMYKMLSQSQQSLFSNSLLNHIEESILEAVLAVTGPGTTAGRSVGYFKLISRVTKHIHSKRSTLLTYSADLSWIEALMILCNAVKLFSRLVVAGDKKLSHCAPLPLPHKTQSKAQKAFRRAMMVIVCLSRWRTCLRLRMKSLAADVIDFVFHAVDRVTDGFSCVSVEPLAHNIVRMMSAITSSDSMTRGYASGVAAMHSLLEEVWSSTMRCDVIGMLTATLRERHERAERAQVKVACCSRRGLKDMRAADSTVAVYLIRVLTQCAQAGQYSQYDLQLVAQCMKLLHVLRLQDPVQKAGISVPMLREMLMAMSEKQNASQSAASGGENFSSSSSTVDKAHSRRGNNVKERNNAFRRATGAILTYIQSIAFIESRVAVDCRPHAFLELVSTLNTLLAYYHTCRVDVLRAEAATDEDLLKLHGDGTSGKESGGNNGSSNSLLNSLSQALCKNGKDSASSASSTAAVSGGSGSSGNNNSGGNSKKRYQDLITKPMEFCRAVEGFVVPSDKLLNNYKGMDFSIATWILTAKKNSSSKYSFVAGKVSHSDVWPLIILRQDGKLEIQYGHNNEFEKLVTEAVVPHYTWTHVAVVVEQKKIKIFVNGTLDCQVNSTKGNNRAVLYPLVIGGCPASMRTRIVHIRDGFDGMLSQFKYYSRALSPIHVKVIHDHGPPETIDLSERISYQLMASLKCLVGSRCVSSAHCAAHLQTSADLLHRVFVTTDNSRRLRFAALDVLSEILRLDGAIRDLQLSSKLLASTGFVSSSQSIMQCSSLELHSVAGGDNAGSPLSTSFHERTVLYFMRLLGSAWTPQSFVSVIDEATPPPRSDSASTVGVGNENAREELLAASSAPLSPTEKLARCLYHFPALLSHKDSPSLSSPFSASGSTASLGTPSGQASIVERLIASGTTRGEICSRVSQLLCALATSAPEWSAAIVAVLSKLLAASAVCFAAGTDMDPLRKVDTMGCVVLLAGGTAGAYLGARVNNFFGDSQGTVLSVNKTTSTVTLLAWNAQRTSRQITKVRLSDLRYEENTDRLPLQNEALAALLPSVFGVLNALSDYVPLLLTDMYSTFCADHFLQSKLLLRCMRPVELFAFSQLLQCVSGLKTSAFSADLVHLKSAFYSVVQQAAMATLRLDDYEDEMITEVPSMNWLWTRCAHYIQLMPTKVVRQCVYNTSNDEKIMYDFVKKHLGVEVKDIVDSPFEKLLTQGRLAELIQYVSVDSSSSMLANIDELIVSNAVVPAQSPAAATMMAVLNARGIMTSVGSRKYLMSDWASAASAYAQWPTLLTSGNPLALNEQDYIAAMQLLYILRKNIVMNSRAFLSDLSRFNAEALTQRSVSSNMLVWQSSLPPHRQSYLMEIDTLNAFYGMLQKDDVTWTHIAEHLCVSDREAVTQSLAYTLRYSVSLLQETISCPIETNILVTSDLFRRSLQTMHYWLRFNEGRAEAVDEVYVHVLRVLLCKLTHISNDEIQIQLASVCVTAIRNVVVCIFGGYRPSSELLEFLRGHNFSLLRSLAQIHVAMHKSHQLNNVAPLAYVLSQLVAGVEMVQHHGSILEFEQLQAAAAAQSELPVRVASDAVVDSSRAPPPPVVSSAKPYNSLTTAKIQLTETSVPRILGVRSSSVDVDLSACVATAVSLLRQIQEMEADTSSAPAQMAAINAHQWHNVTVEVALATGNGTSSFSSSSGAEVHFDGVYCGTSTKFSHSDLVPDCAYLIKCRAYFGAVPLTWSPAVEFRTERGTLFTFDRMKAGVDIAISGDGLSAAYQGDDTWSTILGTRAFTSGVTSWEIRITKSSTAYMFVGVASSAVDLNTFLGGCEHGWGFIGEQALYHNREKVKVYGECFLPGDVIGVTLDLNHGTLSFSRNHKSLGLAFDKVYGELYPAVAFYNVDQQVELLSYGFRTSCTFESIPVSPARLSLDDIGLLNELVLCLHYRHPLSHRLLVLVAEHCNQWSASLYVRCRAVSGKDVFLAKESALLRRFGFSVGDRVRTFYGVAAVAGVAFNKVWFRVGAAGEVWYFSTQQILEGRAKKYFLRCSYDGDSSVPRTKSSENLLSTTGSSTMYDAATIQELVDPAKWSEDMDSLLLGYLAAQSEAVPQATADELNASHSSGTATGVTKPTTLWSVSSAQVCDNFRTLQQQLSRLMLNCDDLSHRWGIAGPKRKAVLARLGLLRLLNQQLDVYLPFLIADTSSNPFAADTPPVVDDFSPMVATLRVKRESKAATSYSDATVSAVDTQSPPPSAVDKYPFIAMSWAPTPLPRDVMHIGPLHAIRRRVFTQLKLAHFWEVVAKSVTRPSKTEDDYDYPDDLPHVRINRLKSFRAREASELMGIPGEDLLLSSMFCQLWRELRQHSSSKLRICYTHPMDDGQSRTFKIKFDGEGVDDYGGPYREIFQQICEELQRPDPSAVEGGGGTAFDKRPSSWSGDEGKQLNDKSASTRCFLPLLVPTANWASDKDCKERYRYTFNPSSTSSLRLDLYHFLGQLVGIAIRSKITLDLALPSLVWKCLVCERLNDGDLASIDATAHDFVQRLGAVAKQLASPNADHAAIEALRETAREMLADVTWTVRRSDGTAVELVEGGASMQVEVADISRYLTLFVEARLSESKQATDMFRAGLVSIIPESVLSLLTWEEVQTVVCGARVIDVQRLKENTEYDDDISADDPHIVNFWEVLTEFTEEEKSTFLKFVWARPTLPPKGVEFSQRMRVLSAVGDDAQLKPDQYLPKAHTCFFSINLPRYTTKQLMADKLRYAIANCTEMDADFKTTDAEIVGWGAPATAPGGDWS